MMIRIFVFTPISVVEFGEVIIWGGIPQTLLILAIFISTYPDF